MHIAFEQYSKRCGCCWPTKQTPPAACACITKTLRQQRSQIL